MFMLSVQRNFEQLEKKINQRIWSVGWNGIEKKNKDQRDKRFLMKGIKWLESG